MNIAPPPDDHPASQRSHSLLQRLVAMSITFRSVVIILAGVLILFGLYTVQHAKFDVLPDFVPPQVSIQCEAPGLSPEQVEALVTRPIETAVNGAGHVESVRSQSVQGLSVITVIFQEDTDILVDRQMINERLNALAGALPTGVKTPKMEPMKSGTMDLLKIGLLSDTTSPFDLRTFADWTLRPRLLSVNGVAGVSVFGGDVRQLQIQVNPDSRHSIFQWMIFSRPPATPLEFEAPGSSRRMPSASSFKLRGNRRHRRNLGPSSLPSPDATLYASPTWPT
jgi:Cu/Ag efflux pump CusA